MDIKRLSELIEKPETQQVLLGHYTGSFSLGVTRLNNNDRTAAVSLKVEDGETGEFPKFLELEGEHIPVVTEVGWSAPKLQLRVPVWR